MIEPLEPRIAPATMLITTGADGSLTITGSAGSDGLFISSPDRGRMSIQASMGNLSLDGSPDADLVHVPMPRGAVVIDLGAGNDNVQLTDLIFQRGLTIDMGDGTDGILLIRTKVRGGLAIDTGADDDRVIHSQFLEVAGNLTVDLGTGASDAWETLSGGASLTVRGDFHFRSAATQTSFNAGGFAFAQPFPPSDDLELARFQVGGVLVIDALASGDAGLLIAAAQIRIGTMEWHSLLPSTAASIEMRGMQSLDILRGLAIEAQGSLMGLFTGEKIAVGKTLNVINGDGAASVVFRNTQSIRLPAVVLDYGDGDSNTEFSSNGKIALKSISLAAGDVGDSLTVRGFGRIPGNINLDFGLGGASANFGGSSVGPLSLAKALVVSAEARINASFSFVNLAKGVSISETNSHTVGSFVSFTSVVSRGPVDVSLISDDDYVSFDSRPVTFSRPSSFQKPVELSFVGNSLVVDIGATNGSIVTPPRNVLFKQRLDINGFSGHGTLTVSTIDNVVFKKSVFFDGNEVVFA